LKKQKST